MLIVVFDVLGPVKLCGSRKYPYPPHGRSLEIRECRGFQRPKFLKESMKLKYGIFRGVVKVQMRGGGVDIFWCNTFILRCWGEKLKKYMYLPYHVNISGKFKL